MKLHNKALLTATACAALAVGSANSATIILSDDFENGGSAGSDSDHFTPDVGAGTITGYSVPFAGSKAALLRNLSGMSLINPLALDVGGYASVSIDFQLQFDDGKRAPQEGENLLVFYSAAGDFTDQVQLQSIPVADLGNYNAQSITITDEAAPDADPLTVDFTDTAKIRFVTLVDETGDWTHIDNVVISGVVPEPGSLALMGLGGLCVLRRRRG